jgi:hypothetical protein
MAFQTSGPETKSETGFRGTRDQSVAFWNHQLRGELEAVRFEIWHALMERTRRKTRSPVTCPNPPLTPNPLPDGERASQAACAFEFLLIDLERKRLGIVSGGDPFTLLTPRYRKLL